MHLPTLISSGSHCLTTQPDSQGSALNLRLQTCWLSSTSPSALQDLHTIQLCVRRALLHAEGRRLLSHAIQGRGFGGLAGAIAGCSALIIAPLDVSYLHRYWL